MSEKEKKGFEDFGKMFGSMMSAGMNSAMDMRAQAEKWIEEQINCLLDKGEIVRREELDAIRETLTRLDAENRELKLRVDALEKDA